MEERYSRAVQWTAPKVAAATAGLSVEGYWLDDEKFFFLSEKTDPSLGCIVETPTIADCGSGKIEEAISLEALARLLSEHSRNAIDIAMLSSADFDMPAPEILAVSVSGWEFLVELRRQSIIKAAASLAAPALYSPDGRHACLVRGPDLWLRDRDTGAERPLTTDGASHYCYGQRSEAGLSAVTYRRRPTPVGLWSPDSQWLLTHRIDERSLPDLALMQHAPPGGGRPILHTFKFPMPDDPLPTAKFVAIHIASGRIVTFDDFPAQVTRPFAPLIEAWFSGNETVSFVRLDRYFKKAELVCLDLTQGTGRVVVSETTVSGYLDLHHLYGGMPKARTLSGFGEVVWYSEKDGWGHLYLHDAASGSLKNRITGGEWMVRDIIHVDEVGRTVLFSACGLDPQADPARRSLCSVNLDGSGFRLLLSHDGDVFVPRTEQRGRSQDRPHRPCCFPPGVSPSGRFAVARCGSAVSGNVTEIVDLHCRQAALVIAASAPDPDEVQPRTFTATAADGTTRLHGIMFLPSDFSESRKYPLIDYAYPGPQVTWQPQSFRSVLSSEARALAELGFVTVMFDTRSMPLRNREIHQVGYGDLLEPQLTDHATVVRQLCERYPFIDPGRIGVMGTSGGGALTARALFEHGGLFSVGVAVCGNHDSSNYGATWSDLYRGAGDRNAWEHQANGAVAHKLEGKLFLVSGDMDENVHVSQTLALVGALVRANKDFDLLIVPNEGHGLISSGYVQRRIWDYFVRNLLGEAPPGNFSIEVEPRESKRFERVIGRSTIEARF